LAVLTALLIFAVAPSLAQAPAVAQAPAKIDTTVTGYPAEVAEAAMFTFTINYDIDTALGEVKLNVELKHPWYGITTSQDFKVSGKGSKAVTFAAPDNDAGTFTFVIWYGDKTATPIVPALTLLDIKCGTMADGVKFEQQRKAGEEWLARMKAQIPEGGAIGVTIDDLPDLDRAFAQQLVDKLKAMGLAAIPLSADETDNPYILTRDSFHTLIAMNSGQYPVEGSWAITRFLASRGNLIALNTPAFRTPMEKIDGKWMSRSDFAASIASLKPAEVLYDFEKGSASEWGQNTDRHEDDLAPEGKPMALEYVAGGANGSAHALHVTVPEFVKWNTVVAPGRPVTLAEGRELTCFWAKGDAQTPSLAIEWHERDDSRWIATVPLTTEWQYHVLGLEDFNYWPDNQSDGRGGAKDHLNPQDVGSLSFGLVAALTPMASGPHQFWLDDIGVAKSPLGIEVIPEKLEVPSTAALTPAWKFFPVTTATAVRSSDRQCIVPAADLPVTDGLMALHPRPESTGAARSRKWRWVPLIEAYDKTGEVAGQTAVLFINKGARLKNTMLASFAMPPASYKGGKMVDILAALAGRMRNGLFLAEAGADYYAYFAGEDMNLSATTLNGSSQPDPPCSVRFVVSVADDNGRGGQVVFDKTVPVASGKADAPAAVKGLTESTYRVTCTLLDADGKPLDMATHTVVTWKPNPNPQFVQVRDGDFYLGDKPWRAFGVNYIPSTSMATEDADLFEYWLDKANYDPEIVGRDLRRIKALGFNMISISAYYKSSDSRNLLDVLERCRRLGLKVNLALRPGTAMDFNWAQVKAVIQNYRLAENDTVVAYDLAWEPSFGTFDVRTQWDEDWAKWIVSRYGSLENAEAEWGVPAPRVDGVVSGPPDDLLRTDGPHRIMVAAYRRFLDDLLAKKHEAAFSLVRGIDAHHPISFRMSFAGDPTNDPGWVSYDFRGLARSVDIMEPEGYGRLGPEDHVRDGRFTVDYARCMAPGRPVMWAEFGSSSWDFDKMANDPAKLKAQADFFDNFYHMVYDSCSSGSVCWYYPGGYRVYEKTDYGIINPDGSWRPVSRVIHDWSEKMSTPQARPTVDQWLIVDRDASARGEAGVYDALRQKYWGLLSTGKTPGLRTDGYGFDSGTCPRKAVGGGAYKPGRNPHKYLDAVIDRLEIKDADGKWVAPDEDGKITVAKGGPLSVRLTVGNIAEAKWLARAGDGQVGMSAGDAFLPLTADVASEGTATIEGVVMPKVDSPMQVIFTMKARPDVTFGEVLTVNLDVK
jgi:hypothetical protein